MLTEINADLHIHTTFSDGVLTPAQVIAEAKKVGLRAIAITDHDTVSGISEALDAALVEGIEVLPGIEINTDVGKKEVHILGYLIDFNNKGLIDKLEYIKMARQQRLEQMVAKLITLRVPISLKRVEEIAGEGTAGRPHIAYALMEKGFATSVADAFEKYIGFDRPAYVPRYKLTPREAIDMIHQAGGVSVLAHPGLIKDDELVLEIISQGIMGLEVKHSQHDEETARHYIKVAEEYGLLMTGGSDSHGPEREFHALIGDVRVSYELVEELKRKQEELTTWRQHAGSKD